MPLQRFRDLDAARRALRVAPNDPVLPDRIRRLWRLSARLTVPAVVRGVLRFRTIEEANAERACRVRARVAALLASREAGPR